MSPISDTTTAAPRNARNASGPTEAASLGGSPKMPLPTIVVRPIARQVSAPSSRRGPGVDGITPASSPSGRRGASRLHEDPGEDGRAPASRQTALRAQGGRNGSTDGP